MKITLQERIYDLSLIWREAEYNFAYWDERQFLDWNDKYLSFLNRIIEIEDPLLYYAVLMKFIALLKDGHSYVVIPEELKPQYVIPITTSFVEEKHILTSVPKKYKEHLYEEIIAVNGTSLLKFLEKYVYPYVWHEKEDSKFYYGILGYIINCVYNDEIYITTPKGTFSFLKYDEYDVIEINDITHEEFKMTKTIIDTESLFVDITTENMAYMFIPDFKHNELKKDLYENIDLYKNCSGFIIDLRYNSGGSSINANALAQLFIKGSFKENLTTTPMHLASYKAYGQYRDLNQLDLENPFNKKIYDVCKHKSFLLENSEVQIDDCMIFLDKPIVILSNHNTASAAESFLSTMKENTKAIIVGSNSYGSNGQPITVKLPGGGYFAICTHKCFLAGGTSYNNIGIKPDIYVKETIENIRNKFDNVFDKGIKILRDIISNVND